MADTWVRRDGTVHHAGTDKCPDCRKKEDEERRKQQAQIDLQRIIGEQTLKWQELSGIPAYFSNKTFDSFDKQLQPKAFKVACNLQWQWVEAEPDDKPPRSLVLLSPGLYGVGKTHLVCALINKIIAGEEKVMLRRDYSIVNFHCPVHFITENMLLRQIRETYNENKRFDALENYGQPEEKRKTEEGIYKGLKRFDLLIIDDVGKLRPRDLNFLQGVYFNIIDQRYNDSQAIILTTNLDFAELENHIGGACADRLREMCGKEGFIKMTGQSYRK